MTLKNSCFIQVIDETRRIPLQEGLGTLPVHVVVGIAAPEALFAMLKRFNIPFIPHIYPDHSAYQASDFKFKDNNIVLMTQKDAVKCRAFADERFWMVDWVADFEPALLDFLLTKIRASSHSR